MHAAAQVRQCGVRSGCRRRRTAHRDDLGAALRDTGHELVVEPGFGRVVTAQALGEHLARGAAGDRRVVDVGELRRGVVAPDRHALNVRHRGIRRLRELRHGAVVIEAGERGEAVTGDVGGGCRGDQRVRVGRVPHDDHAHVVGRDLVQRRTLRAEDAGVRGEQVGALHAGGARACAHEHREVRAVERGAGVVGDLDALQERERAVLQLERGALGRLQPLRDLEQPQPHRVVVSEECTRGDAEQQRVADLAARAGDGDGGGIHGSSLRPRTGRGEANRRLIWGAPGLRDTVCA